MSRQRVDRDGQVWLGGKFVGRVYRDGAKWHHSYAGSEGYRTRHDAIDALYQAKKAADQPPETTERVLAGQQALTTATVPTGQLRVGDVVLTHGMRVRIDEINPYRSHTGQDAWSCPGTVLNVDEVLAAEIVPPSFMTRDDRRDYWAIQGNNLARWTVVLPRPEVPADPEPQPTDPEPKRGWTLDRARTAMQQVGDELQAAADAGALDFLFEDEAQLTVKFDDHARHYSATRDGELVALAKWSGDVLRVYLPGGTFIGRLYRSSGKIIAGETVYTYRANTGTDPLQIKPGEREVARGASIADAIAALLQAEAGERMAARFEVGQRVTVTDHKYGRYIGQQGTVVAHPATIPADVHADVWVLLDSQDPRVAAVGFDADQVTRETEPYMIGGYHACGALVDGGRCGRAPGHEGHPHIKDPGTETSGEYYVMAHGYTAPASRPVARFPYRSPEAGDALDRALAWARQYVKTSFDLLHADASGSALIAQVMADGQFVWVRR